MHSKQHFHALTPENIKEHFDVQLDYGLSQDNALKSREVHGPNILGEPNVKSAGEILIDQFKSLMTALLIAAMALSYLFGDHAEGFAILIVILINAAIGFWAESKAVRSMAALRKMGRATTRVKRDGVIKYISYEDIVPGDVVMLEAGDVITADIRLMEDNKLEANESLLTGESVPVCKRQTVLDIETPLHQQENMLFKGTSITRGSGMGVVVTTGKNTQLGEIYILTLSAKGAQSPLEYRLQELSKKILLVVLFIIFLLTFIGITSGHDVVLVLKTGIALAVAAIPEGLPVVATLALARGMWKLAKRNALIERLSAVETLGSVNVIFTDKTGTLTENHMTVRQVLVPDGNEDNMLNSSSEASKKALTICALCTSGSDWTQLNDPMEVALVKAAQNAGLDPDKLEKTLPRISEEAFDPNLRMMATVHQDGDKFFYAIKGAPEAVLDVATSINIDQKSQPLSDELKSLWLKRTNELASNGMRVLALAEKTSANSEASPFNDIVFLGLVGLADPPRADAASAVQAAQDAGIRVIMVTGDNAETARKIAELVGINHATDRPPIEGQMIKPLDQLTQIEIDQLLSTAVFARMNPRQKLELIELYQKNGAVVAMTGDGVNDAPALNKADIGIAMGIRGTEVAKEAADMVLKDDAFASIIMAIQQGRIIFDNIRKFVIYLLSCNISEVAVVSLCLLAGLPLPLLPLQILFLNLITDVFPALALGFGKGEREILTRPPRQKTEGILTNHYWQILLFYSGLLTISVVVAYIWALEQPDKSPDYAKTIAFLTMALGQLWHVFNMRSPKTNIFVNQIVGNPFIWGAIMVSLSIIFIALNLPVVSSVLNITPIGNIGWIVIVSASLIPLIIGQIVKFFGKA